MTLRPGLGASQGDVLFVMYKQIGAVHNLRIIRKLRIAPISACNRWQTKRPLGVNVPLASKNEPPKADTAIKPHSALGGLFAMCAKREWQRVLV